MPILRDFRSVAGGSAATTSSAVLVRRARGRDGEFQADNRPPILLPPVQARARRGSRRRPGRGQVRLRQRYVGIGRTVLEHLAHELVARGRRHCRRRVRFAVGRRRSASEHHTSYYSDKQNKKATHTDIHAARPCKRHAKGIPPVERTVLPAAIVLVPAIWFLCEAVPAINRR